MAAWTILSRTTDPAVEPVAHADVQLSERIDTDLTEDEPLLDAYIVAAREWAEGYLNRALIEQVWTMKLSDWPYFNGRRQIDLPKPPLVAVTSIAYVDTDGAPQTLAASEYSVISDRWNGYIVEAYGKSWPSVRCQDDAITVVFRAGYGATGASVPQAIRTALKRHVRGQYERLKPEDREALECELRNLLSLYRVAPLG